MFDCEIKVETKLDAIDTLDQIISKLRGLGYLCVGLCADSSASEEDMFALIADIAYQCAEAGELASKVICENYGTNKSDIEQKMTQGMTADCTRQFAQVA